jgi:type I restriction enzyme S subunit
MSSEWRTVPLKDLCENFKSDIVDGPFGANLKREHYKQSGIPVLKIQNIKPFEIVQKKMDYVDDAKAEELKRHNYKKGDIIITKLGLPLGISAIVEDIEDGVIVADLVRVRANKVNTKYLCYHLNSPVTNAFLNEQQGGSTRPRVRIKAVRELPINVPPLPEQERIVSILDKAFEGIDKAIAQTEQNLASARELFESYLNNIFTQKGEDWVEKKLGDICQLVDSLHKTPKYIEFGGFPMVRVTDIKDGTINLSKARRVSPEVYEEFSKKHKPMLGDIVLSRVGTYGVPAVVETTETFCLGQNTIFLLPTINPYLIFFFMLSRNCREQVDKMVSGTTQPTISMRSIREMRFPLPPKKKWKRIIEHINALREQTQLLEALYTEKLNDLKELKQSLLQQAFAGELTKEDAA